MANFGTYPKEDFSTSQNFLARNPSGSGEVIRVGGQSILDAAVVELEQSGTVVQSIDTLTEAIATDYQSGTYVLTGGGLVVLDGDQAIYRVSDPGSGGIVMTNGNELVVIYEIITQESIASQVHGGQFMTYGGTADAITLTSVNTVALTAVATGDLFRFRATAANTGATTINPDGIVAVACLTVTGVALPANYIRTDVDTVCTYDGTNYIVQRAAETFIDTGWTYERSENGLMSATNEMINQGPISTGNGSLFSSSVISFGTLPVSFTTVIGWSADSGVAGAHSWCVTLAPPSTTNGGEIQLFRASSSALTTYSIVREVKGRWY